MNSLAQKIAPPAVVLGAAIYLGMPPAAPLDLGESLVRASAVRWKKDDLQPPVIKVAALDPFQQVLVASETMEVEPETGKLVVAKEPSGPTAEAIRSGMSLSGIATMGGRRWAVINGKPRLQGDVVKTNDAQQHACEIASVHNDHVVVTCQETVVQIRPRKFDSAAKPVTATSVSHPMTQPTQSATTPDAAVPAPPTPLSASPVAPPQA